MCARYARVYRANFLSSEVSMTLPRAFATLLRARCPLTAPGLYDTVTYPFSGSLGTQPSEPVSFGPNILISGGIGKQHTSAKSSPQFAPHLDHDGEHCEANGNDREEEGCFEVQAIPK